MELYKKVEIKSEKDLPKKDGEYFAHLSELEEERFLSIIHYDKNDSNDWLESIDWYLRPVDEKELQEQKPKITDEEIEKWAFKMISGIERKKMNVTILWGLIEGAKAMRDNEIKDNEQKE